MELVATAKNKKFRAGTVFTLPRNFARIFIKLGHAYAKPDDYVEPMLPIPSFDEVAKAEAEAKAKAEAEAKAKEEADAKAKADAEAAAAAAGNKADPLDHDGDGKKGGSPKPEASDAMADLREEYAKLYGKRPFMGWDEATLRAKIAEKTAGN